MMMDPEPKKAECLDDSCDEGRENNFMDVDRMVNEGLGGGTVSMHNGLIDDSTTDTMGENDSLLY